MIVLFNCEKRHQGFCFRRFEKSWKTNIRLSPISLLPGRDCFQIPGGRFSARFVPGRGSRKWLFGRQDVRSSGRCRFFPEGSPVEPCGFPGSGLKEREAVIAGIFDGQVVTEFEVQKAVVLEASPVTSEKGITFTVVDASGDPFLIVPGHDQHHIFTHGGLNLPEKIEGEVGAVSYTHLRAHETLR